MGKRFVITFAGDTSLGDWYLNRPNKKEIKKRLESQPSSFFDGVKSLLLESDHLILNLETVLEREPNIFHEDKQYPNWDDPDRTLAALIDLGVTAVSLANNHTMDYGPQVMMKTRERLLEKGIMPFGAGKDVTEASKPFIINLKGERSTLNVYIVAGMRAGKRYKENYEFFATDDTPGINEINVEALKEMVKKIRENDPRALIVGFPHWQGMDYQWASSSKRIQDICNSVTQSGIDYVIGHGPHILNPVQVVGEAAIIYSIGNFIFNSPGRYNKMQAPPYSLVVQLHITEKNDHWEKELRMYPVITDNRSTGYSVRCVDREAMSALLKGEQYSDFYKDQQNLGTNHGFSEKEDGHGPYFTMVGKIQNGIFDLQEGPQMSKTMEMIQKYNELVRPGEPANEYEETRFSTIALIRDEFRNKGYKSTTIDKYLRVDIGNELVFFLETESTYTSLLGYRFGKNKELARKLLIEAEISVVKGKNFGLDEKLEALTYALSMTSAVIKPSDGNKGKGITVGVSNEREFSLAWEKAKKVTSRSILVEEQFTGGVEARYLVVGGSCVAVVLRIPPNVVGNGKDSIETLIEHKNEKRRKNPNLRRRLLFIDEHRKGILRSQGYEPNSIPLSNERVMIDWKGGLSTGADSADITDKVHWQYKRIAERAAQSISGLDIAGVDIISKNHCQEADKDDYAVIEINTRPGIGGHHYPYHGPPRNAARRIVDYTIKRALHLNAFSYDGLGKKREKNATNTY